MIVLTPEVATALLDLWDATHGPQLARRFRGETVVGEIDERTVVRWMIGIVGSANRKALLRLVPNRLWEA